MDDEKLGQYVESMDWINPKFNISSKLGEHIGNGRFVNPAHNNLETELALLDNPGSNEMIGDGVHGNVFLHRFCNKLRVAKVYKSKPRFYFGHRVCNGITQFRCLRKIKKLGYETPELFAASESVLIMDFLPYKSLFDYIGGLDKTEQFHLRTRWLDYMAEISKHIGNEYMDKATVNGYVKPNTYFNDFGVIDQG